jgi:PAS domain S-box-containing protein
MTEAFKDPDPTPSGDAKDDLRRRTEARAGSGAHPGDGGPPAEPTDATFHELRVHQIELEMQNEELRRAQADLEASRARYFDLYDLAPVGYCTLDAAGIIEEVNLTAARMFGVTKDLLVGKPLTDFVHRDSQDTFYRHRKQLQDSPAPRAFELLFQRRRHGSFWGWVEIQVARGLQDAFSCRVAFTDITLLKQRGGGAAGREG